MVSGIVGVMSLLLPPLLALSDDNAVAGGKVNGGP